MSQVKERYRQTFTVPSASGSYAFERITFGAVASGMAEDSFQGVTVSVDTSVTGMSVELWLPRVGAGTKHPSAYVDDDYKFSGKFIGATGAETWALAGYPGAQIRVKSGGTSGSAVVSASAF